MTDLNMQVAQQFARIFTARDISVKITAEKAAIARQKAHIKKVGAGAVGAATLKALCENLTRLQLAQKIQAKA